MHIEPGTQHPFIGFDTESRRVYGNSGCNYIMASLKPESKQGILEFSRMASTMMAGPNMETESKVLAALQKVSSFKKVGKDKIELCSPDKTPVILLQKRFYPMKLEELEGQWNIESAFGQPMPEELEQTPHIIFDINEKKISGMAACNRLMGQLNINDDNVSISIPPVATTRMACPHIEVENNILTALSSAKRFGRLDKERITFFSANGSQVLVLRKAEQS